MIDFPASPSIGQSYAPAGGPIYTYDGVAWNAGAITNTAAVGETPPPNPANGQMWWRPTNGQLYVYYDDGNTKQWVQAGGMAALPNTLWEPVGGGRIPLSGKAQYDWKDLGVYDRLRFTLDTAPSAAAQIYLRVSADNGVTFDGGAADYAFINLVLVGAAITPYAQGNNPLVPLTGGTDSNFVHVNVDIGSFNMPWQTTFKIDTFFVGSTVLNRQWPTGYRTNLVAHNALRLGVTSGTFTRGYALLEGLRG